MTSPTQAKTASSVLVVPTNTLKANPERSLLPDLPPDAFAALKGDIAERGIQTPLQVNESMVILSGHARHRAAVELGLPFVPVTVIDGLTDDEQTYHLLADNVHRRHLNASQRALLVASMGDLVKPIEEAAKSRQMAGSKAVEPVPQGAGKSRDELGKQANVSGKTVDAAKLVLAKQPEKAKAIMAGTSNETVTRAAKEIRDSGRIKRTPENYIHDRLGDVAVRKLGPQPDEFHAALAMVRKVFVEFLNEAAQAKLSTPDAKDKFVRTNPKVRAVLKAFDRYLDVVARGAKP